MPRFRLSNWWLLLIAIIFLLLILAARTLAPSNLRPTEKKLIGTWNQVSPESNMVIVLGPDRIFKITGVTGRPETITGRWSADQSNFFFTEDDSSGKIGFLITRLGWGNRRDQELILELEDDALKLGTEAKPIIFLRHNDDRYRE